MIHFAAGIFKILNSQRSDVFYQTLKPKFIILMSNYFVAIFEVQDVYMGYDKFEKVQPNCSLHKT